MELKPNFYDSFQCIASACHHTCCKGWEIDIDKETAAYYETLEGEFADRLHDSIENIEGIYSFRLKEDEACPMLRADGLCDLILALGEDGLCDICAMHPRFFGDIGEDTYSGLGLSCEEALRLLLRESELILDSGEINIRFSDYMCREGLEYHDWDEIDLERLFERSYLEDTFILYRQCEPINEEWEHEFRNLYERFISEENLVQDCMHTLKNGNYKVVYQYLIYRMLDRLEEYHGRALSEYAQRSVSFIVLWDTLSERTMEHIRRWSEQMEYSEDNTMLLLEDASFS